jgi:hypothetical protein
VAIITSGRTPFLFAMGRSSTPIKAIVGGRADILHVITSGS